MLVLDTNHLDALVFRSERCAALHARLQSAAESGTIVATTIVCVQEKLAGWISIVQSANAKAESLVDTYDKLGKLVMLFSRIRVLPYDRAAADRFDEVKRIKQGTMGVMDMRIAAIALVHGATVLTANIGHFRQVPGLNAENWLD
jgi:tRNA(fMet)-specific endonuclease VapC